MFKHELVEKVKLEQITSETGYRVYRVPTGELLPSVTTRLTGIADKTDLNHWRDRVGHDVARGVSFQACHRGNAVHNLCEDYLLNRPVKGPPVTMDSFKQIRPILDASVDVVHAAEFQLYSLELWTAGTSDGVVKLKNGKRCVIDYKTLLRTPKEDSEKIRHYKIQTTCYAMMFEELYGLDVPLCMVICSVDHDKPAVFPFRNDYYRDHVREIFSKPLPSYSPV